MNKKISAILVLAIGLSLSACASSQDSMVDGQSAVDTPSAVSAEEADILTIDNMTDTELAELTGLDADFNSFLESQQTKVSFLKKDDLGQYEPMNSIVIFSGAGEDSTALYVYEEDGAVSSARLDEFSGVVSTEGVEYDCMFYHFRGMTQKQPKATAVVPEGMERDVLEAQLVDTFVGRPLYELQAYLDVYVPVYRYEMEITSSKLDTYMLVNPDEVKNSTDVNVIYDESGTVLALYLDDSYGTNQMDPFYQLEAAQE